MPAEIRFSSTTPGWTLRRVPTGRGTRRGGVADPFAAILGETGRVEVAYTAEIRASGARRGAYARAGPVVVEAETTGDGRFVLMVRHSSGAISFHMPSESARRGGARKSIRFSVPISEPVTSEPGARRGTLSQAPRTVLLKVAGVAADLAMPALGRAWETFAWKLAKRVEGWKRVTPAALDSGMLPVLTDLRAINSDPSKPNLLLLHGTFSNAVGVFSGLATTRGSDGKTLFEALGEVYGDRIFAFDHFTVSRSPEDNVKMLTAMLPGRNCVFDVITHSRGGLVLRHLVEWAFNSALISSSFCKDIERNRRGLANGSADSISDAIPAPERRAIRK